MVRRQVAADSESPCDRLGRVRRRRHDVSGSELRAPDRQTYFAPFLMSDGVLQDALQDDAFCAALLTLNELPTQQGKIPGKPSQEAPDAALLPIRRGSAEQSNSSIIFGDQLILKLFRRQQAGQNPEIEIGQYLDGDGAFRSGAALRGVDRVLHRNRRNPRAVAIVQGLVANEGDGWTWTTEELERYYEISARTPTPADPQAAARSRRRVPGSSRSAGAADGGTASGPGVRNERSGLRAGAFRG